LTISLDYILSSSWATQGRQVDLRTADEMTLRYDCFLGDVIFTADGADFSARWGWVPILDFALSLRSVVSALTCDDPATLDFTESDAALYFRRAGATVGLSATWAPATARVPHADLLHAATEFLSRVLADLTGAHPELGDNDYIASL
jgi:hypothetical protein